MHNEGPVREEIFHDKQVLHNLKTFMTKEGYEEKDIEQVLKNNRSREMMLKAVRRMQHYNEEGYVKPKCFDRWRLYVHLRKLFKYWLNYANHRGEFLKSDLYWAFSKWRHFF